MLVFGLDVSCRLLAFVLQRFLKFSPLSWLVLDPYLFLREECVRFKSVRRFGDTVISCVNTAVIVYTENIAVLLKYL